MNKISPHIHSHTLAIAIGLTAILASQVATAQQVSPPPQVQPATVADIPAIAKAMAQNVTPSGMPKSYAEPSNDYYREIFKGRENAPESVIERLMIRYDLNIYDGAVWQIALSLQKYPAYQQLVDAQTQRLLSGKSGSLGILAQSPTFTYNGQAVTGDGAFIFRSISDMYGPMTDPLTNSSVAPAGFPQAEHGLHKADFRPVLGENAWATIIGPLQSAYLKYSPQIPLDSPEMRLAVSKLETFEIMQDAFTGGVLYAPTGTSESQEGGISAENNISLLAGLRMLREAIGTREPTTTRLIDELITRDAKGPGIEDYFKERVYNSAGGILSSGGFVSRGLDGSPHYAPYENLAVDVQTWGLTVLGADWVDEQFGEGTAFRIWSNTKQRAGLVQDGVLLGVGYTDGSNMLSGEWTLGAVLMAKEMARTYRTSHPDWAQALNRDADTMLLGVQALKVTNPDGSIGYLYAN
ncbi:MAG: hypothetical protein Q7U82_06490, partial [Gammaproteobacteria bacterium]|nr:hypothetical protein [Gammaproteobacteria bacterium]